MNERRQEAKERARLRKERARKTSIAKLLNSEGKDVNRSLIPANRVIRHEEREDSAAFPSDQAELYTDESDTEGSSPENSETTDSETIL